jgi:peptide/nickel transport system substrate-binding protein
MPQHRRNFLLSLIAAAAFLFGGCGTTQNTSTPANNSATNTAAVEPRTDGTQGGTLTARLTAAPKTLNYVLAGDESTMVATLYLLTSRLIEFDHRTQKFVPGLAETWKIGADGKTVDAKLREGLKFSDGTPITAADIGFTLATMYDERTKAPAFRDAMLVDGKEIAFKQINEREMQFTFPKVIATADPYLVNLGALPKHVLGADFAAGKFAESWKIDSAPTAIISSGPFVLANSVPGERIEYTRNPNYWKTDSKGTRLPYLDKLVLEVIPDANNTFVRLGQGSLDLADRIRPNDYIELNKTPGTIRARDIGPGLGIDHMWFNMNPSDAANATKRAWFAEKKFRHAVASAIDRETIAAITLQGMASPLYGFVSPANKVWIKQDLPKIKYDLKEAEKLLAEAGFKKTGTPEAPVLTDAAGNPVQFTLIVPAENEPRKLTAAVIQQDLGKLGIKMEIAPIEFAGVNERWSKTLDYDAILLGLSQTDIEPASYANFILSSAAAHQWRPKQATPATEWEARVDKLFEEQAVSTDMPTRLAKFGEIQSILREEMPVIPIVARHVASASNLKIGNYAGSSIFPYSLWNVDELFMKAP